MRGTNEVGSRQNVALSAIVETAVGMSLENGRKDAARFLHRHGASFKLIVRVLSEPNRRRRGA